jgi:hypothetical protein
VTKRTSPDLPELTLGLVKASPPPVSTPVDVDRMRVPLYPEEARRLGIEGTVKLRFSLSDVHVQDINADGADERLVEAALESARSWRFRNPRSPVVDVTFTYELLDGECNRQQQPTIEARLPYEVKVVARRLVICGEKPFMPFFDRDLRRTSLRSGQAQGSK